MPVSIARDTILMYYFNDLCEKSIYANDPKADERLEVFKRAQEKSPWPNAKGLYLRALGKKYDRDGDYQKALECYHEALAIFEKNKGNPEHMVYTKIMLGFVMLNSGDEKECWRLFKEAEPYALKLKNTSHAIWIIDFFADNTLYHAKNEADYKKALAYYKRVEELLPNSLIENQIPNNLQGQAAVYKLLGDKEKSKEYRARALVEAKKIPIYFVLYQIYQDYAFDEQENANFKKALEYRQLAINAADSMGYLEFKNRSIYDLYETFKASGDAKNALKTLEEYLILEDSLKRQEVNEKYAELSQQYEFEKQQVAIKSLENKNLRYGILALAVTLIGGVSFLVYQNRSKKKIRTLNLQLSLRNKEVEEALYEGKKIERRRVSDRLHDHIATKVSALKWKVEASETKMDKDVYEPLVNELEKIYEDIRSMAHALRPLEFLDLGLKLATEELFKNLAEKSNAQYELEIDEAVDTLNKSLQYHVYQMITELCTNLKKHAKPDEVSFKMLVNPSNLKVTIANNGLLSTHWKEGQGIRNLKQKLAEYKGEIKVEVDQFFKVDMSIPLS